MDIRDFERQKTVFKNLFILFNETILFYKYVHLILKKQGVFFKK